MTLDSKAYIRKSDWLLRILRRELMELEGYMSEESKRKKVTVSSYSQKQHSPPKKPVMHAWKIHLLLELTVIVKSMWTSTQEKERLLSGNHESLWPDQTCLVTCTLVAWKNQFQYLSVLALHQDYILFIMTNSHGLQWQLYCREKSGFCTTSNPQECRQRADQNATTSKFVPLSLIVLIIPT